MSKNWECRQQDGLYGLVDENGEWVIQPRFDHIFKFDRSMSTDGDTTEERTGNVSIRVFSNGKFGYVNEKGEWTIEPKYDYLSEFKNGRADARLEGGKRGYVDEAGNFTEKKTKKVTLELHQRKTDVRALRLGTDLVDDYREFWFTDEFKFDIYVTDDKGNELFAGKRVEPYSVWLNHRKLNDAFYETFYGVDTSNADEVYQHAWERGRTCSPDILVGMLKECFSKAEAGDEGEGELLYDPTSVSVYFEIEVDEEEGFNFDKLCIIAHYDPNTYNIGANFASVIRKAIGNYDQVLFDTIIYDNKMYAFYDTNHVLMESKEAAIDPETLASPDGYYDEDDEYDDDEDDEYYDEDDE